MSRVLNAAILINPTSGKGLSAKNAPAAVRRLREAGLLSLVGGTYAENVLTASDDEAGARSLRELFALYERHLGCPPEEVSVAWVPERVWDTDRLAALLTDPSLPNGGYRHVLLDDRLLHAASDGSRERFDGADPTEPPPAEVLRPYRIAGGRGLVQHHHADRLRGGLIGAPGYGNRCRKSLPHCPAEQRQPPRGGERRPHRCRGVSVR